MQHSYAAHDASTHTNTISNHLKWAAGLQPWSAPHECIALASTSKRVNNNPTKHTRIQWHLGKPSSRGQASQLNMRSVPTEHLPNHPFSTNCPTETTMVCLDMTYNWILLQYARSVVKHDCMCKCLPQQQSRHCRAGIPCAVSAQAITGALSTKPNRLHMEHTV